MSKNREVFVLKLVTLSIAFASSILIILFSLNEFGYDRFHHNSGRIFRVVQKNTNEQYSGNRLSAKIPPEVHNQLKSSYQDTLAVSRLKVMNEVTVQTDGKTFHDQRIYAADLEITTILSFNILHGDVARFGTSPDFTALISSRAAQEYIGTTQAEGKKIKLYTYKDTLEITVAAVFSSFPENSHEDFDVIVAFNNDLIASLNFHPEETSVYGRALLVDPALIKVNASISTPQSNLHYTIQPLPEIYFGPRVLGEEARHGDRYSVIILICIAGLILFLSLGSFVNLTTITLPYRSKEIAIKKLAGTSQLNLLYGFIRESSTLVAMSLFLGLSILFVTDSLVKSILNLPITSMILHFDKNLLLAVAILFIVLTLSPVLMTIRFVQATPNRLLSTDTITFPRLKRLVAFFQLGISIFLIIASVVIGRQITYSLVKEPGQNHDQIVFLNFPAGITNEGVRTLRTGWKRSNPNILDVMAVSQLPDRVTSKEIGSDFYLLQVDAGFKEFFDLQMREGFWFGPNAGDSIIVTNKSGKERMHKKNDSVIGVVEDLGTYFNQPEKPIKISIGHDYQYNWLCVRVLEVDIRKTVEQLSRSLSSEKETARVNYLNSQFASWVNYQDRLNKLSALLTVVSGVLSCFAIYGLSVSLVRDKLKEIAVHKLLGANTTHVTYLLAREFVKQMIAALAVFGLIAYISLNELLRTFVFSTQFTWLDPVYPIAYCLFIIMTICSFQALALNRTNFASALKS